MRFYKRKSDDQKKISHLAASSPTPGKWRFSVSWSETWIKKTVSRFKITQAQPQFEKWWQNSTWPDLSVNFENIVTDLTLYEYLPRHLPGSPNMLSGCDTTLVGLDIEWYHAVVRLVRLEPDCQKKFTFRDQYEPPQQPCWVSCHTDSPSFADLQAPTHCPGLDLAPWQ